MPSWSGLASDSELFFLGCLQLLWLLRRWRPDREAYLYRVIKFWNTFCFYIIYKIHHTSVPDKRDMEKRPVSCSTLYLYWGRGCSSPSCPLSSWKLSLASRSLWQKNRKSGTVIYTPSRGITRYMGALAPACCHTGLTWRALRRCVPLRWCGAMHSRRPFVRHPPPSLLPVSRSRRDHVTLGDFDDDPRPSTSCHSVEAQ